MEKIRDTTDEPERFDHIKKRLVTIRGQPKLPYIVNP
jgi:hypothetical protein